MEEYTDKYGVVFKDDGKILFRCPMNFHGDYVIPDGTIKIAPNAFAGCAGLNSITIPSSVENIGIFAFNRCTSLTSVEILSDHIKVIQSSCFRYCSNLRNFKIPSSVRRIESYAFTFTGLTSIALPDNIEEIGYGAFSICRNLSSVHFPDRPIQIHPYAFHGCEKLNRRDLPIHQVPQKEDITNEQQITHNRGKKRTRGSITDGDLNLF